MRKLFMIASISLFSLNLLAFENAMNMVCEGPRFSSFILYIDSQTNQVKITSLFDGDSIWLAKSIAIDGNNYSMKIFHPQSAASGKMLSENEIKTLSFNLPAKRRVTRVQTGGYYIPVYTTYPAEFKLHLDIFTQNCDKPEVIEMSCIGY